jgi:hypothetical protein
MAKTLDQLKADVEAANRAYAEAQGTGEAKLNEIARQQDAGIRPEFHREDARDEHGNPIKLDKFGNPEWRAGKKIEAARARPVYTPPLRSPLMDAGALPPDIDFKTNGTWDETKDLWLDLVEILTKVDHDPLTQEQRETCVQQIVPSLLDRLAATVPRVDCAFSDGPMGKGSWLALVAKYQMAFNPSKGLERSIGTMRTRVAPKFTSFALEGAKWLFRRSPHGIPKIEQALPVQQPERDPDPDPGPHTDAPPRKRGRPKRIAETNVSNLE